MNKVTKKLNKKKKDVGSLHEGSRDAKRLNYAAGRDQKIIRHAIIRSKMNEPYLDRIRHLQNAIVSSPERPALSSEELLALIREYIASYEPELKDLQAARRPGRPPAARENWLKSRIDSERKEFDIGYWVPNMLDADNIQKLSRWDGEWSMLSPIAFVRIDSKGVLQDSRWPPNGMS